MPEIREIAQIPELPEVPEPSELPEVPELPETSTTHETPAMPKTPETPVMSGTPDLPDRPGLPDVADLPELADLPEFAGAPRLARTAVLDIADGATPNGSPRPEPGVRPQRSGEADRHTVLVTGAGGPAGIAVIRSLQNRGDLDIVAADMSPLATGLYLVPARNRWIVPAGADPAFPGNVLGRAIREGVDIVVPTVDSELLPLSTHRKRFAAAGLGLAVAPGEALASCLDKLRLAELCGAAGVPVPRTVLLGHEGSESGWSLPAIVKPRRGSGSRGVRLVHTEAELHALAATARAGGEDMIVQEYLPGEEFSVDVLADPNGHVIAAVPRARLRIDSGVAVAGRTLRDPQLEALARAVAEAVGLTLVANVQFRRDHDGEPKLLEVNPRFPGSMPLTVASGVDMPSLMVDMMLGRPVPRGVAHEPMLNMRYLEDCFLPADEADPLFAEEAKLRESAAQSGDSGTAA